MTPKRLFDVTAAGFGLLLCLPLFAGIALTILLTDGPPVFFRQERVGRGGQTFRLWKFRTMRAGSSGRQITVGADSRITPIGAFLRRHKLDELPQLLNVLRGDMSLVGPRPEVPAYVSRYSPAQRRVLAYAPGVTDPASLAYRDEASLLASVPDPERYYVEVVMPEKIRLNLEYAEKATLLSDIRIIARTVGALVLPSPTPGAGR